MSTFPAAPDDPFAAALGARPPTSPFRPGDGASPPHLAGRKRLLATAADRIRACHERRPMPPLGFHGPSGIGKTALLDQVQAEIIARGGVVARLSGHSPQTALSTLAAAHDRLTGTDQSAADVPAGDVAAVFAAAAQTAANDDRVFMVLVDDMHAGSALTEDLGAAYDAVSARGAGAGLIVAGVHDHGRLDRMPHGIQSLEVSYLQPDEAHDAIATPLRHHDVDVDPDLVQAAANRSGGLPLHVQAWGDELWLAAHDPDRPTDLGLLPTVWTSDWASTTRWPGATSPTPTAPTSPRSPTSSAAPSPPAPPPKTPATPAPSPCPRSEQNCSTRASSTSRSSDTSKSPSPASDAGTPATQAPGSLLSTRMSRGPPPPTSSTDSPPTVPPSTDRPSLASPSDSFAALRRTIALHPPGVASRVR